LLGSAFKNKGVQPLLDAVIEYLPSPIDIPPVHGIDPRTEHELSRRPALDEPFSALAFKVMSDPYVGKLTYFRVYSGKLKAGDRVLNTNTGKTERISRILQMHANHREEREEIGAGEIAAGVGLKATTTGETLATDTAPIKLESMMFPDPVISVAVEPKSKADQDKLGVGLQRLAEEDPTFRVRTDDETGQTLIAGMGELHLEIIVDRLKREFSVDANVGRPQVAYRETMGQAVEKIQGRFVRQTGGRGQYGHAVKVPGSMAFKEAMRRGKPKLLEPVMAVEVITPEDYLGDVMGNLNSRRGRVESLEPLGNAQVIKAIVPLAEMFGYATDVRSMTQGRAEFTMQFERYEEVPQSILAELATSDA